MKTINFAVILSLSAIIVLGAGFFIYRAEYENTQICNVIAPNVAGTDQEVRQSYALYEADIAKCHVGDVFAVHVINSEHSVIKPTAVIATYCDMKNTIHLNTETAPAGILANVVCTFTKSRKERE